MRFAFYAGAALALLGVANAGAQPSPSPEATPQTQTQLHGTQPTKSGNVAFGSNKCHGVINVASDAFEGDFQTKVGTYTGNVIVTQAECRLKSDKLVAEATTGNDLNRLTATGNVVFISSSGTATGDMGVYDLGPKTITMTGKVILTKGKDVMRGTHLVVDINTGLAHLTAKGLAGGRVQSSFVPKRDASGESPKPQQNSDK